MSFEENMEMLKKVNSSDFKGIIELNLSCPNVPGKPQTGYDFEATERILQEVFTFIIKQRLSFQKQRLVLSKTTARFTKNNGSFYYEEKQVQKLLP